MSLDGINIAAQVDVTLATDTVSESSKDDGWSWLDPPWWVRGLLYLTAAVISISVGIGIGIGKQQGDIHNDAETESEPEVPENLSPPPALELPTSASAKQEVPHTPGLRKIIID